jgi:flavodoxin short chain
MNINIVYWSGTGNTEAMADFIKEGAAGAGAEVNVWEAAKADEAVLSCDVLILGCPSMGDEVLEEECFEPFIISIEGKIAGKKLALFGSYGWGDGKWMRDWSQRMTDAGAILIAESLIVNEAPEGDECRAFGARAAGCQSE